MLLQRIKMGLLLIQPWIAQIRPNVVDPISRLIFQALQYRSKYAEFRQLTGEHAVLTPEAVSQTIQSPDDEDAPFLFVEPILTDGFQQVGSSSSQETPIPVPVVSDEAIEWWQESALQEQSHKINTVRSETGSSSLSVNPSTISVNHVTNDTNAAEPSIVPVKVHKTPASQRTDLPSWLMDQPTQFEIPALRPSSLSSSNRAPTVANDKATSSEKHAKQSTQRIAEQSNVEQNSRVSSSRQSSSEWQLVEKPDVSQLQSLTSTRRTDDFSASPSPLKSDALPTNASNPALTTDNLSENVASASSGSILSTMNVHSRGNQKRNYAALTTALQTLGLSIPGFIATAIVNIDGQPIAQVAVDDQDISGVSKYFSSTMQDMLQALEVGAFGHYEDTIITSLTHFILFRLVGGSRDIFQVLIVTRDADLVECLEIMVNIEPVLEAAM